MMNYNYQLVSTRVLRKACVNRILVVYLLGLQVSILNKKPKNKFVNNMIIKGQTIVQYF